MVKKNDIIIPVFDGEDYSMWKKRIMLFLKFKKCDEVITRAKTAQDKDPWDDNDLKVMNYIYRILTNKQLVFISDKPRLMK